MVKRRRMKYKIEIYTCGDPQDSCLAARVMDENNKEVYDTGYILDFDRPLDFDDLEQFKKYGFNLEGQDVDWSWEELVGEVE